jgi:hypothetical protein
MEDSNEINELLTALDDQINFDECLVFQKLSRQENIILAILDYVDK